MTRNDWIRTESYSAAYTRKPQLTEIRPLRPNQAVILPGVAVKGKGVKLETKKSGEAQHKGYDGLGFFHLNNATSQWFKSHVNFKHQSKSDRKKTNIVKTKYNYRSRTGFSQNDGIAQFSGSFSKRSYQRSLSVNELSFFERSDFVNDDYYQHEDHYFRSHGSKRNLAVEEDRISGTPNSPNPYLDYYIEDRAKVAKNYDLGHELHMDLYDTKLRASITPSPANTARGTPSSLSGRVTITPARNSPGFQSPGIQRRPVTSNYSSNTFPIKLSQRSASMLTLPRPKKFLSDDESHYQSSARSRSITPTRAFTSHHALCTNQGHNVATSSQGVQGTYEFLFNRHLRALTNLETGSLEYLEKVDHIKPVDADAESMTESEELDLLGEDLVNSSLAEVTENLDRQIDVNENGKRKRISFNVPPVLVAPSEEVDEESNTLEEKIKDVVQKNK